MVQWGALWDRPWAAWAKHWATQRAKKKVRAWARCLAKPSAQQKEPAKEKEKAWQLLGPQTGLGRAPCWAVAKGLEKELGKAEAWAHPRQMWAARWDEL